jgi:NodT family efflux transporter outer membrane factor (OMF) lipoprotein
VTRFVALPVIALALAGCMVGPDYVRPSVDVPAAYKESGSAEEADSRDGQPLWKRAEPGDAIARGKWWEIFGDPQLSALAERVDIGNQNIREAEARFRQANALARQARAGLFPLVSGSASAARVRRSGQVSSSSAPSYEIALDAAWELDVWGRVRRSIESAEASWQASAADLESVRLSAQAALVQSYIALRIADAQRQLFEDTVAAYSRSLDLTQNRYAAGTAAKADVVLAQVQLLSAQADLLDIGVARAQLEHAIALLIGEPASTFSIPPAPIVAAMPATPVGVPSELLERRPDIATAERNVAAANAQIGVAQAAFYPALTLSATGGYGSAELARLVTTPNQFWSLGAALAQTLFDAGARRALSDRAIAAYDAEVAFYRQTVLAAFQDVEDNLAALRILEEEARVQDEVVRGARQAVELTTNQYKAGIVSYLNVIAAQTIALNNERTAVNILGRRLAASVALVRALGGGWSADELEQYRVSRLGKD